MADSNQLKMYNGLPQQCRHGARCRLMHACNFTHYDVCFYFMSARRDHECTYQQCTSEHPKHITRHEIHNYVNSLFEMNDGTRFYMCEYISKNVSLKSMRNYNKRQRIEPEPINPVPMPAHAPMPVPMPEPIKPVEPMPILAPAPANHEPDHEPMQPVSEVVALHTTSHLLMSIMADYDSQIAQLQMQIDFINRQKERILNMQL